jgi:hypothetical protein
MPGTRGRSLCCCWKATGPRACLPRLKGGAERRVWSPEKNGVAACWMNNGGMLFEGSWVQECTPGWGSDGARRARAGALRARYAHGERCVCGARGVSYELGALLATAAIAHPVRHTYPLPSVAVLRRLESTTPVLRVSSRLHAAHPLRGWVLVCPRGALPESSIAIET